MNEQLRGTRDVLIVQAAGAGVIQAAQRSTWEQAFNRDPVATTKQLATGLAHGRPVPVAAAVTVSASRRQPAKVPMPAARTTATAERDQVIDQAVADGKIPNDRRGIYEAMWASNSTGARDLIGHMAAIPELAPDPTTARAGGDGTGLIPELGDPIAARVGGDGTGLIGELGAGTNERGR